MPVALGADHYVVPAGGAVIIDAHGVCRNVSNMTASGGYGTMVPTKLATEWHEGSQSFLENLPVNITVSDCELYGPDAFVVVYDSTKSNDGTLDSQILVKKGWAGMFNFNISWEDSLGARGTATGLMSDYIIDGVAPGLVTVAITGSFPHFRNSTTRNGVVDVKQWGTQKWVSMGYAFAGETGLVGFSATDTPDMSLVTDMSYMFYNASSFNQRLNFDTSKVTNMSYILCSASSFNQPLDFDTSKVTDMSYMLYNASSFNQPLEFDTSSVTDMSSMLSFAISFNQPLEFDTSQVTNMGSMFWGAYDFDQPLNFDTSNVMDMSYMFQSVFAFNQDLSGWCVAQIASKPFGFDDSASRWTNEGWRPKWGEACVEPSF